MRLILSLLGALLAMHVAAATPYEVDTFQTQSGKKVLFTALKHASIRISYEGTEIQIDPVRKLGQRVTDYTAMPKADFILVTHEHGDHFDREAIQQLSTAHTRLVTNSRCSDMARSFIRRDATTDTCSQSTDCASTWPAIQRTYQRWQH